MANPFWVDRINPHPTPLSAQHSLPLHPNILESLFEPLHKKSRFVHFIFTLFLPQTAKPV
jgi:hypothetical protein